MQHQRIVIDELRSVGFAAKKHKQGVLVTLKVHKVNQREVAHAIDVLELPIGASQLHRLGRGALVKLV